MRKRLRSWLSVASVAALAVTSIALSSGATQAAVHRPLPVPYPQGHHHAIDCASSSAMCTEVADSDGVFGHYVGHDEPSMLFDSNVPGSGNHMRYNIVLPKNPSAHHPNAVNKSYAFELSGAEWLGMAMCDTQSYPEQLKTCPRDSNKNIVDPAKSPKHVGQAYMEMQFYPPGWIPWPTWQVAVGASSCNPTMWCAAMNIDSLSLNPVTGKANNTTCLNKVGEEYVNFAFITKNGKSTGPANPVDATTAGTYTPQPADLFMHSGDHLSVAFTDSSNGEKVTIKDLTTGQAGFMTASKANGFAEVKYDPSGTSCTAIPTNFHAMYSTSSPQTRVTWAAGGYNVAMDTEIGHFQFCSGPKSIPATKFGLLPNGNFTTCPKGDFEGRGANKEPSDPLRVTSSGSLVGDDGFCFPGKEALVYKVTGCSYTNDPGWDGASYQKLWPDGNTKEHPTPFQFTSPTTGRNYTAQYSEAGFETDLPATELYCNAATGKSCTRIPIADNGKPAVFYPFYSTTKIGKACYWQFGNAIPGEISNFGKNAQYGPLLAQSYTQKGGGSANLFQDYQKRISNPCK
jgi:hypothetical protein